MSPKVTRKSVIFSLLLLSFLLSPPLTLPAATTPTMIIEEAKFAIEEARKAGADRVARDDYMAAKSWLSQAEKEYDNQPVHNDSLLKFKPLPMESKINSAIRLSALVKGEVSSCLS